nr:MAG TPA: hypothetical protein [Caudoviricetes sp.]
MSYHYIERTLLLHSLTRLYFHIRPDYIFIHFFGCPSLRTPIACALLLLLG